MDPEKTGIGHHEALHDDDVVGEKKITHEEAEHLRALSPEEKLIEKKLKKKIDTLIMPTVVVVYLMNYIDRNNYAAARLQGLVEDLNLEGNQYQTGLSILFVGYVSLDIHMPTGINRADVSPGAHASAVERCDELCRPSIVIHRILHGSLGTCIPSYQPDYELRKHRRLPFHPGYRRGTICKSYDTDDIRGTESLTFAVRRRIVLSLKMVHQIRTQPAHVYLLLCFSNERSVRSSHCGWHLEWNERRSRSGRMAMGRLPRL